jgi:ribosomal protein L18E
VALWESLKALGPGLRDLKKTIEESRAVAREGTAPVPKSLREQLEDSWEELEVAPVGPYAVLALVARLKTWLCEGDALLKEANRIRPRGEVAETNEAETTAIARYLVTVSSNEGRPITKHIAALLEVAHGLELPQAPDARDAAWEKRLEKWKKALERARASVSPGRITPGRRQGGQ